MQRQNGRAADQLRPIRITKNYVKHPEGSCLIEFGDTRVICTATVEEEVPSFLMETMSGWVTAEYGMLPRSCATRIKREKTSGRIYEIQRLVGRSLRGVVDLEKLGPRTIKIDCDVIQADGGTRTASITGGFIALAEALLKLKKDGIIKTITLKDYVAAISVGIKEGTMILDLDYDEDSTAAIDMNVVMVGRGEFVEIQGTAEGKTFARRQVEALLNLAEKGIKELIEIQKQHLPDLKI